MAHIFFFKSAHDVVEKQEALKIKVSRELNSSEMHAPSQNVTTVEPTYQPHVLC